MKSQLRTKKSLIAVVFTVFLLISLSYIANKTIVTSRLEEMEHRSKYSSQTTPDGLYLVEYEPDQDENKVGIMSVFIGNDYMLSVSNVPPYCNNDKISVIGSEAYKDSESVEKVILPQTIKKIRDKAFANCKRLKEIYIPSNVVEISKNTFNETKNFTMYVEKDSYSETFAKKNNIKFDYYTPKFETETKEFDYSKTVSDKLYKDFTYSVYYYNNSPCCAITYYNPMSGNSHITVPKEIDGITVRTIAPEAFFDAYGIETITLPNTITGVGAYAFANCTSLKKVIFKNNNTLMGKNIFDNSPHTVIYADNNSSAQKYALKNNIEYKKID